MLCFSKFSVAKMFWIRRGKYQDFPSSFFCVSVPKNFIVETFIVPLISGIEKL